VPADSPVTAPVALLTTAIAVLLLLQVPPVVASVSGSTRPTQILLPPVMGLIVAMALKGKQKQIANPKIKKVNFFIKGNLGVKWPHH